MKLLFISNGKSNERMRGMLERLPSIRSEAKLFLKRQFEFIEQRRIVRINEEGMENMVSESSSMCHHMPHRILMILYVCV